MEDIKKVSHQLNLAFAIIGILLIMNTLGLILAACLLAFEETSFFIWALITFTGWLITTIQFKKNKIYTNWKNNHE